MNDDMFINLDDGVDTKELYKEMRYKALEGLLGEGERIADDGVLRFSYDVVPEEILKDSKFFVCAFMIIQSLKCPIMYTIKI